LMPTGKYSGVSRKIESADERNRLKGIMKLIRPEGMATVVRTAAAGMSQAELIADLGVVIRMWHGILETYKRAPSPSLIHKDMNLVYKAARDFITPEVERVLIDDGEEYEKVRDFMRLLGPQYVERIQHYNGGRSLFKDFKVDEEVQKLMRPKVNLPSGGSIVIETTEALTVIDVNSGKFTGGRTLEDTIVKTNIEAAAEIARQVRLRDIGGIIVCDFIDMSSESARNRVIATLEAGLRKDRTRTTIQSFSALGLLEFTRKRVGKDLAAQLRGPCPTCEGIGSVMSPESVAIDAFREIRHFGHEHQNGKAERKAIDVVSAPTVGAQIEYWYETELESLEKELERKVAVRVDPSLHPERTKIGLHEEAKRLAPPAQVRVGDEVAVDLIHARLPVATSALAIVGDRLVEVENAAAAVGQTVTIKVIDVDDEDGTIIAEPVAPLVAIAGEGKKRRRRGGRGRKKELTPAEQEDQLRELAEEAAKGLGGRPAIGISTSAEAEAEDAETRAHAASSPPLATVTPLRPVPDYAAVEDGEHRVYASYGGESEVRRKRRRRRRRRGAGGPESATVAGIPTPTLAAEVTNVELEDEVSTLSAVPGAAREPGDDGNVRRRRRRRRRRGRGGAGFDGAVAAGAPAESGTVPERHIFRVGSDGVSERTGTTAPPEPSRAIARLERKYGPVAVDAPPPSLSMPEEPPKFAKPARGRPRKSVAAAPLPLEASAQAVLPAGAPDAPAPKKRASRAKAQVAAEDAPVKAPRARKKAASDDGSAAKPAKTRKTAAAKSSTGARKKPATARKKSTT
ncbi:MAG TPA: Rne/Rng family ribonuclease, partial [Candidatus Baltobacteraceae bacterium]|nr:Rne/Rng family ribonuclease [Candidatus Baltobacteraceae bacterium]